LFHGDYEQEGFKIIYSRSKLPLDSELSREEVIGKLKEIADLVPSEDEDEGDTGDQGNE
jgi:hypothetical protein